MMSSEQYRKLQKQSNRKLDKLVMGKQAYECKECGNLFVPASNGKKNWFCSQLCANRYNVPRRPKNEKPIQTKICAHCKSEFQRNQNLNDFQWSTAKYCSVRCANSVRKIDDGMSRAERSRRKKGAVKKGSPEWVERIRATTIEGMAKPEVREKLAQPRAPMTEEAIRKRADKLVGKMPKNLNYPAMSSGSYANVQRGDYECSKGTVYFRSKWEANYALFLDFLVKNGDIEKWEYEVDMFVFEEIRFGTRSYRPDFKVFTNDGLFEYHEVKGHMNSQSKTKLKRMEKYYPEVKIVLVDQPYYSGMYKKFKKILNLY